MSVFITIGRYISNVILAALILILIAAILASGYATVALQLWERTGLDDNVVAGDWAWIDENPIYYHIWGEENAPTVVLVHGYAVEGSVMWEANARFLERNGLRVITVDLQGFGYSARHAEPDYGMRDHVNILAQLLNQLHVRDATLVGHGWGCGVVLQLAAEQPQFVERMVLVSPTLQNELSPLWRQVARVPYVGTAGMWAVASGGPIWRINQTRSISDPDLAPYGYWDAIKEPSHIIGTAETFRMMALSTTDDDLAQRIPSLTIPTLILVGEQDDRISETDLKELMTQLGEAELIVLSDAGHAVQIEQSFQVNEQISEFVLSGTR